MRRVAIIITLTAGFAVCGCASLDQAEVSRHNRQGVGYLAENKLPQAHAQFVEAWKQEPNNADTLYNLASTYHRKGQLGDAERYYRLALQQNPDHAACRHNYYMLLVSQNRQTEARSDAEKWRSQRPQSADALTQLGWLTRLQGDLPTARTNLEQALTIDPKHVDALLEMGKLYQDFSMPDRAKVLYRRVLQQEPENAEATALLTGLNQRPR